ncbi:MAG TPA: histidinol-phosphate transaminase [Thermoanaerobaculia bacterium]|nr:histidinol-phosphate transaminase [Thermoanaerobaculia bacterium]HUM29598.1 histidinol-phosphate transaminase [Thermoanaerobaculia bacterium]HXK67249.1 histidinol-phosphate transaminase [Thermoanaerobaculia bacterium]
MKIPDYIQAIHPYIPGRPIEEVEREVGIRGIIKLASNENPLGPSPKALEAMASMMGELNRYPDGGGYYLRKCLSERFDWPMDGIILGSGSVEIIELLCRAFLQDGSHIVMSDGAFIMYKLAAQQVNARVTQTPMIDFRHDLKAMARAVTPDTPLVFIANPNNPTGTYVTTDDMKAFLASIPKDTIVVMDEAYFEYMDKDDYPDSLEFLKSGHNVITLRTFSKIYGLAGLRIGYGFGRPEIFEILNRIRSPFNTTTLAQVAGMAALEDQEFAERVRNLTKRERERLEREFNAMGVSFVPSVGNFILVDVGKDAKDIFSRLLKEGVIVRPVANYGLPNHLRVSIGTEEENTRFLKAFKTVMG